MASRTQFQANQVSGFDPNYYLSKNPDVGATFDHWFGQQPMNFAKYVQNTPHIEKAWRRDVKAPADRLGRPAETRVSWGEKHWNKWGKAGGDPMAYNVGDNYYLMSKGADDQSAKNDFGAWHYDIYGQGEGRFKSESDWYNSPGQRQERQNAFQEQLLIQQQDLQEQLLIRQEAYQVEQMRIQEEMAAKAARVKGSSPTGVGGAASIKGSRLSITEAGGRKGTQRFSRPTQFMNTLGIGSATPSTGKSTLNL